MNALERNRYSSAWADLGASVPRPRAILVVSAHWYVNVTAVTAMARPRTIHDFYGFPRELFEVQYPAPGSPELAEEVVELVRQRTSGSTDGWGLDHGTLVGPGARLPRADVPWCSSPSMHAGTWTSTSSSARSSRRSASEGSDRRQRQRGAQPPTARLVRPGRGRSTGHGGSTPRRAEAHHEARGPAAAPGHPTTAQRPTRPLPPAALPRGPGERGEPSRSSRWSKGSPTGRSRWRIRPRRPGSGQAARSGAGGRRSRSLLVPAEDTNL
jgi:hypothetical protein